MKNIFLSTAFILLLACGCEQQDIPTYNDLTSDRYVYLYRAWTDSTETSFFFYPGQTEILYPVSVRSTGTSDQDETYKIAAVAELTTAPAGTYEIPAAPVMRAGRDIDTCYIKLKLADILNTTKVRLVIQLQPSEHFLPGRTEYREAIIWFHNIIAKPAWWTSTVTSQYLGEYSDEKYTLFLDVVGVDLRGATDSQLRNYALVFKKYLTDKKNMDPPETVYEKDGREMTVTVLGNL
ncbi:MAG: DUF4843 domain-containing protein [Odoribacteraceae bacterium]|jgi:hypothetical protein|nr:DUF4843 domain-containing protein [Odoribacteraceae bacterium]